MLLFRKAEIQRIIQLETTAGLTQVVIRTIHDAKFVVYCKCIIFTFYPFALNAWTRPKCEVITYSTVIGIWSRRSLVGSVLAY